MSVDSSKLPLHELKTQPPFFESVLRGDKRFELRKNDRNFSTGDAVLLREWNPLTGEYTGRNVEGTISYLLEAYPGLVDGYCILGFKRTEQPEDAAWRSPESYPAVCAAANDAFEKHVEHERAKGASDEHKSRCHLRGFFDGVKWERARRTSQADGRANEKLDQIRTLAERWNRDPALTHSGRALTFCASEILAILRV